MSEQVLRRNVSTRSRTRTITQIAMLGAIAGILMNLEFPIPFLAPSFFCNGTACRCLGGTCENLSSSGNKGYNDSRCR